MEGTQESLFYYQDTFVPVRSRKKRKDKIVAQRAPLSVQFERAREEIEAEGWMAQSIQILQNCLDVLSFTLADINVLCLGLGSPCSSRESRIQLAFLLRMCDHFEIAYERVSVYDPVFTDEDVALLTELKLCLLTQNKHGKYPVHAPTILFMPHCEAELYENVLSENWTRERISNVLLIANHLDDYVVGTPSHKLEMMFPCLSQLAPHVESRSLPRSNVHPTAFNNCSVQFVRRDSLAESGQEPLPFPRNPKQP